MCERDKTQERKIKKKKINFQMINFKKKEKNKRKREPKVNRDQAKRLETFAQHTQSYTKILQYKTNGNIRTLTRDDSPTVKAIFTLLFRCVFFFF